VVDDDGPGEDVLDRDLNSLKVCGIATGCSVQSIRSVLVACPPREMSPQIPPDEPGAADEAGAAGVTDTVAAAVTATVAAATVARLRKAARATDDLLT